MLDALLRPGETRDDLHRAFHENVVVDASGCWFWRGKRDAYGQFRGRPAHCVSWELAVGPIPEGLFVLHGCDLVTEKHTPERGCVNPAHLRPGTPAENVADAVRSRNRARAAMENPAGGRRDVVQAAVYCRHERMIDVRLVRDRDVNDSWRVRVAFDAAECLDCGKEVGVLDWRSAEDEFAFQLAETLLRDRSARKWEAVERHFTRLLVRAFDMPLSDLAPLLKVPLRTLTEACQGFGRTYLSGAEIVRLAKLMIASSRPVSERGMTVEYLGRVDDAEAEAAE